MKLYNIRALLGCAILCTGSLTCAPGPTPAPQGTKPVPVQTGPSFMTGPCDVATPGGQSLQSFIDSYPITGSHCLKLEPGTYNETIKISTPITLEILNADSQAPAPTIDAQENGSVIRIPNQDANITIRHINLKNGRRQGGKGGGLFNRGTLTLDFVSIENCRADQGGGIFNNGTLTTIENPSFVNDNRAREGGGIFNGASGTLTAEDLQMNDNRARQDNGGAIYNKGALTITRSRLRENKALRGRGGGIYSESEFHGSDNDYIENTAGGDGGAIHTWSNLSLDKDTFTGNRSDTKGGAVFVHNSGSVTVDIEESAFAGNKASSGDGFFLGGNYVGAQVTIANSSFADSAGWGGAVYMSGNQLTVDNSDFRENEAGKNGGAIRFTGSLNNDG